MSFGADGKRGRADSSKQGKTEQPKTKLSGCVTKTDAINGLWLEL